MRIRLSGRIDELSTSIFDNLLDTLGRCDAELCELDFKALEGLDEAQQARLTALRSDARSSGRRVIIHFPLRCFEGGREGPNLPALDGSEEEFQLLRVVR